MAVKEQEREKEGEIYSKKSEYHNLKYFILVKEIPSGSRFVLLQYLIRDDFTSKCVELFYTLINEFGITSPFEKGSFLWEYKELPESADNMLEEYVNSLRNLAEQQIDFFFSIKKKIDYHLKEKLKKLKYAVQEYKKIVKE